MRHGIRAPNQPMDKLAEWSHREWPVWSVALGHLTARGRELIAVFWHKHKLEEPYKSLLYGRGHCVTPDNIFVHADIDERTQPSAAAFAAAIASECLLPYFITYR
jgi:4-phytase/acid phosphatase